MCVDCRCCLPEFVFILVVNNSHRSYLWSDFDHIFFLIILFSFMTNIKYLPKRTPQKWHKLHTTYVSNTQGSTSVTVYSVHTHGYTKTWDRSRVCQAEAALHYSCIEAMWLLYSLLTFSLNIVFLSFNRCVIFFWNLSLYTLNSMILGGFSANQNLSNS